MTIKKLLPKPSKQRYLIQIQFLGRSFHGSQSQKNNQRTVQVELEKALGILFRQKIKVILGSRVDAKVNALSMTGHFDLDLSLLSIGPRKLLLENSPESLLKICLRLNGILKNSLRISDLSVTFLKETRADFHAIRDAFSREYQYRISLSKVEFPIWDSMVSYFPRLSNLNLEFLNHLSQELLGIHDFKNFSIESNSKKNTICKVKKALWRPDSESGLYLFEIEANRFLYRMVRLIVGIQIAIARSLFSIDLFYAALKENLPQEKKELLKRQIAAPEGLFLKKINYLDCLKTEYNCKF